MHKKNLIIIINYKDINETIECINSIINNDVNSGDILIVDNESDGENRDSIKSIRSGNAIHYIFNNKNTGFAYAINQGVNWAHKNNYLLATFINNDTRLNKNAISLLIERFDVESDPHIVAYIPVICYLEKPKIIWNAGGRIFWFGFRQSKSSDRAFNEIEKYPDIYNYATGCCILFKIDTFKNLGGYDERFFFGEEDFNFALRLLKSNDKFRLVKESVIYHKVSKSISGATSSVLKKTYLYYLNRFIDIKILRGVFYYLIFVLINLPYIYFKILKKDMSFKRKFKFLYSLIIQSYSLDEVSKETFDKIIFNKLD